MKPSIFIYPSLLFALFETSPLAFVEKEREGDREREKKKEIARFTTRIAMLEV